MKLMKNYIMKIVYVCLFANFNVYNLFCMEGDLSDKTNKTGMDSILSLKSKRNEIVKQLDTLKEKHDVFFGKKSSKDSRQLIFKYLEIINLVEIYSMHKEKFLFNFFCDCDSNLPLFMDDCSSHTELFGAILSSFEIFKQEVACMEKSLAVLIKNNDCKITKNKVDDSLNIISGILKEDKTRYKVLLSIIQNKIISLCVKGAVSEIIINILNILMSGNNATPLMLMFMKGDFFKYLHAICCGADICLEKIRDMKQKKGYEIGDYLRRFSEIQEKLLKDLKKVRKELIQASWKNLNEDKKVCNEDKRVCEEELRLELKSLISTLKREYFDIKKEIKRLEESTDGYEQYRLENCKLAFERSRQVLNSLENRAIITEELVKNMLLVFDLIHENYFF